jgi:2-polyprenyl-3-methyl-5-hydroxy-6-metoxy-1,4-benzoquinol methylase
MGADGSHISPVPPSDRIAPQVPAVSQLYGLQVEEVDSEARSPIDVPPCIICGDRQARPVFTVEQMDLRLVSCVNCGLGRLEPQPSPEEIRSFYPPAYYGTGGAKFEGLAELMVRLVGARHARFLTRPLRPKARVLDVGCGRGVTLRALADWGCEMHGFEVAHQAVENIDPRVKMNIAPSLAEAQYPDNDFDEVIVWHVLEHVRDPRGLLREIHRILKPGGVLVVAVPNFSSLQARWAGPAWFHLDLPRHLFHFPLPALRRLLEDCGFLCQSEHHFSLRQNPFGWVQSGLNRLGWLPRNGLYTLLHRRNAQQTRPFTPIVRLQLRLAYWLSMPPAVMLSLITALMRSSATVHIVARRN